MRVADYIFKTLADKGIQHVFLVTGGGAMHLNDALGRESRIRYICNLHEQGCAIGAEGYARISGMPGVLCVTTGPGGTNAITGVAGAWLDSIPMLILSGQVKRKTTISACPDLQLRQLGDQELNIVDVVRPITKYAKMLESVEDVPEELEKAWRICRSGRPGPVWLDVPLDIQAAELTVADAGLAAEKADELECSAPCAVDSEVMGKVVSALQTARRPVLICGGGIHAAKAETVLLEFARKHRLPVLTTISGIDLIASDDPLFFGRPGILGARAANFIMQNSDCMVVLGSRMGIRIVGYAYESIGRAACKIMVDADDAELQKPTFRPDVKVHCDAGCFLQLLDRALPQMPERTEWLEYCRRLRTQYPVILPEHRSRTDYVSSYVLPEIVSLHSPDDTIFVTGNGTAYTSTFQSIPLREGMRMFSNQGCASMGYGLPAAIGAALAGSGRMVVCFTGDGSLQMNLQELQTLKNYHLNVKLFVYNNDGYLSIKLTQNAFFLGHRVGSDSSSGVVLPSLEKLASAYELPYYRLTNNGEAEAQVEEILRRQGPVAVEVMTDPLEVLGPKAASRKLPDGTMESSPLEDLYPFLPREEFSKNMLPVEKSTEEGKA